jgi:DNA-binding NtrC family response regulator
LDCTVLTETLAESELFGHRRGAFTGSVDDRKGLFKQADGGTLFLDEIGELPKSLQIKLLRVLETGSFRRVGTDTPVTSDARIICATNRDIWQEVNQGHFREDLYYRLACLTVRLPSVRERREDIPDLAGFLLRRIRRPGQSNMSLTTEALGVLEQHDYPGNVRELKNILQAACAQVEGPVIDAASIQKVVDMRTGAGASAGRSSAPPTSGDERRSGASYLPEVERARIARLLREHKGNRAAVARALGVTERTVYRKLKRYGLS